MPSPAPSPFAWPVLIGAASFFLPAVAARAAGRSFRRDAAGQVAGVLLLVGTVGLLGLGQVLGVVPRQVPLAATSSSLAAVLMLAPLSTWIGGAAPRWRGRAQAVVAGALVVAALRLGLGREFRLVTGPAISLWLTLLCAVALARTVRHGAAGSGSAPGDRPTPILGALLTYYLMAMVSRPLIETLVGADPRAVVDAHMGLQLAYAGCMTVVAWGVGRRVTPARTPARGPEPSRVPDVPLPPPVVAPPGAYPEPRRPAQRQAV